MVKGEHQGTTRVWLATLANLPLCWVLAPGVIFFALGALSHDLQVFPLGVSRPPGARVMVILEKGGRRHSRLTRRHGWLNCDFIHHIFLLRTDRKR